MKETVSTRHPEIIDELEFYGDDKAWDYLVGQARKGYGMFFDFATTPTKSSWLWKEMQQWQMRNGSTINWLPFSFQKRVFNVSGGGASGWNPLLESLTIGVNCYYRGDDNGQKSVNDDNPCHQLDPAYFDTLRFSDPGRSDACLHGLWSDNDQRGVEGVFRSIW